jgi:5-methylthioadenosine/S-adenosylhomocysteine deaminase
MTDTDAFGPILLSNATVVTMDAELGDLFGADVLVRDGRIAAVGADLGAEGVTVIDATDHILLPGLVDTHRHVWQAPIRNLGSDWTLGHYFMGVHFGLSRHYRPEDTYAGNLLGAAEALDGGITTILDWSHNLETPEHADAAVEALQEFGGRAVFAHGGGATMWQPPSSVPHTRDVVRVRDRYFSSDDQLVTFAFAARGPQFTTPEVTEHDWALARELASRITVHVGDGEWGKSRPIEWLKRHDLLADDITYVHCCTLADDELAMIADSGGTASVAADIETQMGHGWPATGRLLEAGVRPSLSIDVCVSNGGDMFHAMKTTISTQRALDNAAEERPGEQSELRVSCRDVLEFATIEGARAVGLDSEIGSITPGKQADLILVRTDDLAMTPMNNPTGALVYNAHAGLVDLVMVAGRIVKRDGRLVELDTARIRELADWTRDHLIAAGVADPTMSGVATGGGWLPSVLHADGS